MHRTCIAFVAGICASLLCAHPMGNFSVNHYARIVPHEGGADISYTIDLAEIPTQELFAKWNLQPASPQAALESRAVEEAREWVRNLHIRIGGSKVTPQFAGAQVTLSGGVSGMKVMRIDAKATVSGGSGTLEYEDPNFPDRSGWKEIVVGAGPDKSRALTAYPTDPAIPHPLELGATIDLSGKTPPVIAQAAPRAGESPQAPAEQPAKDGLSSKANSDYLSAALHGGEISFGAGLICLAVAFGLGALHAFEPGHGKTMVAAYLVGSRGTPKHAVMLGLITTFTHTISVFLLGFVTIFLSHYIMPEKMTKVLGILSGLSIVWIGALMLYRRSRKLMGEHAHVHATQTHSHTPVPVDAHHDHDHEHGHSHSHSHAPHSHGHQHDHSHTHDHPHQHDHEHSHDHPHSHDHQHSHEHSHPHEHAHPHHHMPEGDITMGSLIALGASGGMVPCPAALILLLTCISLGRPGFGMLLLLSFSVGLAIVLMATGLVVLYAKSLVPERHRNSESAFMRTMPVISAAIIVVIGVVMTGVSLGWLPASRLFG